jgi:hypothetical protein
MTTAYRNDSTAPFKMIGRVHTDSNNNHLQQIQHKMDAQKTFLDKDNAERSMAQQNQFFALMMKLFADKLQQDALSEQLFLAAIKSGFSSVEEALNLARNADGQSPLQHAFQKQDFALAQQLMNYGAITGPIERSVFEVALDSKAAKEFGFTPEYHKPEALHTVKKYGLVLGIEMTSKDGTFSQFAHVAPTYQLMTDSVSKYARSEPFNKDFAEIADAFRFSNKAAAFSESTSQRNPEAGKEIAARIQEGKITTIPISFAGHVMGCSVVPDGPNSKGGYITITNRGLGKNPGDEGTQIYRIDDLSKINSTFVNNMMNGHANGTPSSQVMAQIHKITGGKSPVHTIEQTDQKYDNCTVANNRANIHAILLCQKAISKGGMDQLSQQDLDSVKSEYKKFTNHMRAEVVNDLANALKKNPEDPDLKNLAKSYLKSHPHAAPNLKEPLEKALSSNAQQEVSSTAQQVFLRKM